MEPTQTAPRDGPLRKSSDGAARVTLEPARFAQRLDDRLRRASCSTRSRASPSDSEVRAVLITGAGRAFSSGADLRGDTADDRGGQARRPHAADRALQPDDPPVREMPKPVDRRGQRPGASGSAARWPWPATSIVAAESAYFLMAFANIGLTVDGGASAFAVGADRLRARGRDGDARREASRPQRRFEWGLINRVVADDELEPRRGELLGTSGPRRDDAPTPRPSGCSTRAPTRTSRPSSAARPTLQQTQAEIERLHRAGVFAFLQKQQPEFTGLADGRRRQLPTGRFTRLGKIAGAAASQAVKQTGTRAANLARSDEKAPRRWSGARSRPRSRSSPCSAA